MIAAIQHTQHRLTPLAWAMLWRSWGYAWLIWIPLGAVFVWIVASVAMGAEGVRAGDRWPLYLALGLLRSLFTLVAGVFGVALALKAVDKVAFGGTSFNFVTSANGGNHLAKPTTARALNLAWSLYLRYALPVDFVTLALGVLLLVLMGHGRDDVAGFLAWEWSAPFTLTLGFVFLFRVPLVFLAQLQILKWVIQTRAQKMVGHSTFHLDAVQNEVVSHAN